MRYLIFLFLVVACTPSNNNAINRPHTSYPKEIIKEIKPSEKNFPAPDYNPEEWTELINDSLFLLDVRYATENNFMEQKIYDCERCFLRPIVAEKFIDASLELYKLGYKIILYDCYRPRPYQQKLWDIMPNAMYVTPPKKGSMHNRGHAIDIGLYDRKSGQRINFGTEYDYFGKEAHFAYTGLSDTIRNNRKLLRKTMEKYGFTGIRTEWWHFSYKKELFSFSDWLWPCE